MHAGAGIVEPRVGRVPLERGLQDFGGQPGISLFLERRGKIVGQPGIARIAGPGLLIVLARQCQVAPLLQQGRQAGVRLPARGVNLQDSHQAGDRVFLATCRVV